MANELVTVSTHMNETDAYIVVNRLKDIDITATVADANIVGMDFLVASAIRWIKVQVAEADADRALAYLEETANEKVPEEEIPWDDVEPEADEDATELQARIAAQKDALPETETGDALTGRLVNAAYRLAFFGAILFPLALLSLLVLLRVSFRSNMMTPNQSRKFYTALILDMILICMSAIFWRYVY